MIAGPDAFLQYLTQLVPLHLAFAIAGSGLLFKLLQLHFYSIFDNLKDPGKQSPHQ